MEIAVNVPVHGLIIPIKRTTLMHFSCLKKKGTRQKIEHVDKGYKNAPCPWILILLIIHQTIMYSEVNRMKGVILLNAIYIGQKQHCYTLECTMIIWALAAINYATISATVRGVFHFIQRKAFNWNNVLETWVLLCSLMPCFDIKWIAWSAENFIHCSNYSIFTRTPTIFSTLNSLNMINYQSIEKYHENALFCKLPSHFLVNQISIVMPGFQGLEWWSWMFYIKKIVFMRIYLMIQDILSVI